VNARTLNLLGLALVGIVGLAFLILTPRFAELDTVLELTVYMIMAILALSLALIWGYGGILCFGQSAFFGLGAYTYAIAMFNIGESTVPLLLAIALPAAFAALLGYFMFYGRISDVYLGVITLTVTLILFNSVNSTAGPEFHIGTARLGGFNGIPGIPPLNYPGNKNAPIDLEGMFYLATASLLATYFGLRLLLASKFGRIIVGIRGKRAARRASGLRSPRLEACDVCHWRRARRLCRMSVCQLGATLSARPSSASLSRRRSSSGSSSAAPRHADRPDRRLHRHPVAHHRAWGEPARRVGLVVQNIGQRAADPRHHPDRLCAAGAKRSGADARRFRAMAAAFARRAHGRTSQAEAGGGGLMAAPLLETRDLNMRFGGVHAVRNVNFTLAEGELRCLIGPNGAGKKHLLQDAHRAIAAEPGHVFVPRL